MFNKILIANRGEIALRVIRACRELGIKTVAVYSSADADSLPVRFADEAVCIGPYPSKDSYLSISSIISAAEITNADAIHPGYGFLSENASFAKICKDHEIKFIGPSPSSIQNMGDKASAKAAMKRAGVSIVPGSDGIIESTKQGLEIAREIGFPVILKATAGGGGKGMKIVTNEQDFEKAWESARREAQASFGNDGMYLEKYIEEPKHIEIQIVADSYGNTYHLFERDCSIQRRHQKLVEEAPSPFISPETRIKMGQAAVAAAKFINYENVGTIEFLVDKYQNFYFMEMNTRIQVEHPVTEMICSMDLIKTQIQISAGHKFPSLKPSIHGHSIECRINAEDPDNDFRPSPGKIENLHLPGGLGVRVDTHVYRDYIVPPYYDSMVAKLIVWAPTRMEAISRMQSALGEFVIEGIKTTIPLHKKIMENKQFQKGNFNTSFLERTKL